ncbi:hypothetical protein O3P69_014459 [Scylla paramamosain]|uniref:Separin n=1 Tax=Scylla paramamosain TaxID=85552 RepID=A0AAW0TE33_SCYPA
MAGLAAVKGKILGGQVVGLQEDIRKLVRASSSGGEGQLIIRTCSRFVYETPDLEEQRFSAVLEIVSICCEHHREHITGDPFFHFKSMYYIILLAVRRKDLHHHSARLAVDIEPYLELCDTSKEEVQSMVKKMHSTLWNASLNVTAPMVALTLQRFALRCFLAVGGSLSQMCDQAVMAHLVYEKAEKCAENSDLYFQALFMYLTQTMSKQSACDENSVLAIVGLVMEYAKVAVKTGKYSDFGRNNKQLVKLLETHCDSKMLTGLKAGLKLPEMAMALQLGRCGDEMLRKLLGSCGIVAALPGPNTVLVLGLLTTLTLIPPCSNLKLTSYIVEILMKRCRIPVSDEIVKKISSVLNQQLTTIFDMLNGSPGSEPETLFSHVLTWAEATRPFILSHLCGKPDKMGALYSIGIHFGNFGSMAYKKTKYDTAVKLLEVTVDLFEQYHTHSPQEQKHIAWQNLSRKFQLWSDVLRYGGHHWGAGVAAARGFLAGCLPTEDLVSTWVKCKRDAKKGGSEVLRDLTVCDVVKEARRKYKEANGVVFDQDAALLKEIQCYKQQKYNTMEEQLCCGRAVAASEHRLEGRVWGLLAVTEALWTYPDMETEEHAAQHAAQQAKDLLQEAKSGGANKPVLLELEALVHFWQYLCYIQVMYNKADAEVKDADKPNPFTAQVAEPGEEEHLHDRCEGRPTALLSLHTQYASLAPLQAALDIWDRFISEDLPLENPDMACASLTSVGYIYHLSGLAAPTIQAWGLLIALARRHSLLNYLIKGIVELILTAPELVDASLVGELEQMVSSSELATPQDTSHTCLMLNASVATAFLYYKTGKYEDGARLVQETLQSEVLAKRTIKTTEVQTLVHLVASLYAWLPPWLLNPAPAFPAPCFSLALLACRQANALVVMALTDSNKDIICWRHRVASLLLTTTSWLGHLSITTAQPRMARAYIEKSLKFSQQLILPLRIAECLELLAHVDMLCDQLDDCRVKVDSLEALLRTHPSSQEELQDLMPEFTKLSISKSSKVTKKQGPEIFCDPVASNGERMRTESGAQDLHLKRCLPFQAGAEEVAISSPSVGQLDNVAIVRFSPCPSRGMRCVLCATPIIHHLRISTAVLLALLHAHSERFQAAQKCLDQAWKMYADIADKAEEVSSYMVSFLKRDAKDWVTSPSMFVNSRLHLVHLQIFHAQAECLALERKWEKALSVNLQCLQTLATQESQLLIQDMHFVAVLSLQGHALEKVISRSPKSPEDIDQLVITGQQDDESPTITVTTPKMSSRKEDGSSTKTIQNLLNAPRHVNRRNLIFTIPSDEEEDSTDSATKSATCITPHKQIAPTPNKFFKSARKKPPSSVRKKENAENKNILDSLEADWGGTLPSLVLKVPSDLPLSSLNSAPQGPSQHDGERLGLSTSPKSTSKVRNKIGQKTRVPKSAGTRGKSASSLSQNPGNADPQEETAPPRGRSRAVKTASSSTSKAKVVTEPKPATRTRASRSLRLI